MTSARLRMLLLLLWLWLLVVSIRIKISNLGNKLERVRATDAVYLVKVPVQSGDVQVQLEAERLVIEHLRSISTSRSNNVEMDVGKQAGVHPKGRRLVCAQATIPSKLKRHGCSNAAEALKLVYVDADCCFSKQAFPIRNVYKGAIAHNHQTQELTRSNQQHLAPPPNLVPKINKNLSVLQAGILQLQALQGPEAPSKDLIASLRQQYSRLSTLVDGLGVDVPSLDEGQLIEHDQ